MSVNTSLISSMSSFCQEYLLVHSQSRHFVLNEIQDVLPGRIVMPNTVDFFQAIDPTGLTIRD